MSSQPKSDSKQVINESGIEIKTIYTPVDVEASGGIEMIGMPGETPEMTKETVECFLNIWVYI